MPGSEVALPSDRVNAARAEFVSQTTAVEQARAVAEVEAAVIVAQRCPRNLLAAMEAMRESCNQPGLADRAFYKFPRAGGTVSGASVHLARELARCWGNIQYGIQELRRDDVGKYSEMQAWAWDVQTNTRSSTTFVVPHMRDVKGGPQQLVDLRDVYENNANQGSRRLREVIFSVLPTYFTEEAKALCSETQAKGGGKSLPTRIADCVRVFGDMGVKLERLEAKVGAPSAEWTALDVSQLGVSYTSIKQGTVTAEEEIPSKRVTAEDVTAPLPPAPKPAAAEPAPVPEPEPTNEPEPPAPPATPLAQRAQTRQPPAKQTSRAALEQYGDVVDDPAATPPPSDAPAPGGRPKNSDTIVELARNHAVVEADDVVRMCVQILGAEIASVRDLDHDARKAGLVIKHLAQLGEGRPFVFAADREAGDEPADEPEESPAPEPARPAAAPASGPDSWGEAEWREALRKVEGMKASKLLAWAREIAAEKGIDGSSLTLMTLPGTGVGPDLYGRLIDEASS